MIKLGFGFDPFNIDRHAKRPGKEHHRTDNRRIAIRTVNINDERPVDLDLVDREPFKIRQRRITRPKIINRDANTLIAQNAKRNRGFARVIHHRTFGNLELQLMGIKARTRQNIADTFNQVFVTGQFKRG